MVKFRVTESTSPTASFLSISYPDFRAGYDKATKCASDCLANLSFSSIKNSKWTYVVLVGAAVLSVIYYLFSKTISRIQEKADREAAGLQTRMEYLRIELAQAQNNCRIAQTEQMSQKQEGNADLEEANKRASHLEVVLDQFQRVAAECPQFELLLKQQQLNDVLEEINGLLLLEKAQRLAESNTPGAPQKPPRQGNLSDRLNDKRASQLSLEEGIIKLKERLAQEIPAVNDQQVRDALARFQRIEEKSIQVKLLLKKDQLEELSQEIEFLAKSVAEKEQNIAEAAAPGSPTKLQEGDLNTIEQEKEMLNNKRSVKVSLEQEIWELQQKFVQEASPETAQQVDGARSILTSFEADWQKLQARNAFLEAEIGRLEEQQRDQHAAAAPNQFASSVNDPDLAALQQQIGELTRAQASLEEQLKNAPLTFIESNKNFFAQLANLVLQGRPLPGSDKTARKLNAEAVKAFLDHFGQLPEQVRTVIEGLAEPTEESQA